MKHTPEPWAFSIRSMEAIQVYAGVERIALIDPCGGEGHANAARIVDCVNAFKGIENPSVYISKLAYDSDIARRERDNAESESIKYKSDSNQLARALAILYNAVSEHDFPTISDKYYDCVLQARDALATHEREM